MRGNVVHSSLAGVVLNRGYTGCVYVRDLTAYRNWDFGLITMRGIDSDLKLVGLKFLDHMHVGLLPLVRGAMTDAHTVEVRDSLFVGRSSDQACAMCTNNAQPECHQMLSRQSYQQNIAGAPEPVVGAVGAVFALAYTPGPDHKPWDDLKGYNIVQGRTDYYNTTFANFYGATNAACVLPTHALANHPLNPEAFHPTALRQSTLVSVTPEGLFKHYDMNPAWRNENDCGEATYTRSDGTVINLNCSGPRHVQWNDVDGSLTGVIGSVVAGTFLSDVRAFSLDQDHLVPALGEAPSDAQFTTAHAGLVSGDHAAGGNGGPCFFVPAWQAYQCVPGVAPTSAAPYGVAGDMQLMVIESLDADSEDRNVSPVFVESEGQTDVLISAMDHGWCFAYTCQKRLSTFWTYVPTGSSVKISFTGTPPRMLRVWMPYAAAGAATAVEIDYFEPYRRFMWTPGQLRLSPLDAPPTVADSNGTSYFWDQSTTTFYAKMVGPGNFEVRTERVIQVSVRLAVSVDEFYADNFVTNVAQLLNIDKSRIRVVSVVADKGRGRRLGQTGTAVTLEVSDSAASSSQPLPPRTFDTSGNVDSSTQAAIANNPAAQAQEQQLQAAYAQQAQSITQQQVMVGVTPAPTPAPTQAPAVTVAQALANLAAASLSGALAQATNGTAVSVEIVATDPNVLTDAGITSVGANQTTVSLSVASPTPAPQPAGATPPQSGPGAGTGATPAAAQSQPAGPADPPAHDSSSSGASQPSQAVPAKPGSAGPAPSDGTVSPASPSGPQPPSAVQETAAGSFAGVGVVVGPAAAAVVLAAAGGFAAYQVQAIRKRKWETVAKDKYRSEDFASEATGAFAPLDVETPHGAGARGAPWRAHKVSNAGSEAHLISMSSRRVSMTSASSFTTRDGPGSGWLPERRDTAGSSQGEERALPPVIFKSEGACAYLVKLGACGRCA